MTTPATLQPSLFGEPTVSARYHRVSAHTRVLADGSEVFIGEHLRWNRARTARTAQRSPRPPAAHPAPAAQLALFPPDGPSGPLERPSGTAADPPEPDAR